MDPNEPPPEPPYAGLDARPEALCVSEGGRLVYMNEAAEHLLGPRERALGRPLCDLLCGRLRGEGGADCGATCGLRALDSPERAAVLRGRFGPVASFTWQDFRVRRDDRWVELEVTCVADWPAPGGLRRNMTIIRPKAA